MKKLLFFFAAVCSGQLCFSQTDFRKGYIIKNTGDTLYGLVHFKEGARAYKSCTFRSSEGTVNYEPNELIGYGFSDNRSFETKEIKEDDQLQKAVFLEIKVKGLVSLYKFERSLFIQKSGEALRRLSNDRREMIIDGKRVMRSTNQYIGILNNVLFDCSAMRERTQKAKLLEEHLTRLVEDYNSCMGQPSLANSTAKPWTKFQIGVAGGVNISQLTLMKVSKLYYGHLTGSFKTTISPVVGLSLDVSSPRMSERLAFHADVLYLKARYYLTNTTKLYPSAKNQITIELQQLKIPLGLRYTFPGKLFAPFFNIGLSTTLNLSSSCNWKREVTYTNIVETFHNPDALHLKRTQVGLWGGLGVVRPIHEKLQAFAEIRYEYNDGIIDVAKEQSAPNSKTENIQIILGLRIK